MADRRVDVLIVGAGPAGAMCAETLRAEGFHGSILLAGRDPDPPYDRPPCSKEYLRGEKAREDTYLHPPQFWDDQDVELLTRTSVMKLDAADRSAKLSSGEVVGFGQALLAMGSNVRRLQLDGGQLDGVHYLRALGNADAIRADAEAAERVVLVGGSFIACEVAASLTKLGKRCTLVMVEEAPLSIVFGATAGEFFADVLRSNGVDVVTGESVARFEAAAGSADGEDARVAHVITESGRRLDADMVVMGTGAIPDVTVARGAGLQLGESGGVACSRTLETSIAQIWAAGDICEYDSEVHGRRVRVEHWEVATAQGAFAARAMLGAEGPYTEIPYFWCDLADWASLEYVGPARSWDGEIVRGSLDDGEFTIFYLDAGRLVAALTVGRSGDLDIARRLLSTRADLTGREPELADLESDLA